RAAADGDDEVGLRIAGLVGGGNHGSARRMRRHLVESAHAARAHGLSDRLYLGGPAVERAAHHQEGAPGAQPVELLDDGLRGMAPEHNLVHRAEYDTALVHSVLPR